MLDQKQIKQILQKENPLVLEIGSLIGLDTLKFLDDFKDITLYFFLGPTQDAYPYHLYHI